MSTTSRIQRFYEEKRKLPVDWRWVRLGEVCEFEYGSSLIESARQEGTVPVYGSNGIVGFHNRPLSSGPTIVIGRKGSVGQVHYSPDPCFPIDTTYYIDRTGQPVDLRWLAYILSLLGFPELNKASGVPGLNRNDAYKLLLLLPPLPEQRRIAAVLDEQIKAVEKARAAAQARLKAVKDLTAAFLRMVLPNPDKPPPDSWRILPLGDAGKVVSGVTIGRALNGKDIRKVPYLRVANVKDGYLDLLDVVTTPATPDEIEVLKLKQGDLLLTEGGDPDKLGRGTLWEGQLSECIHQNHIFRVRLDRNLVVPKYAAVLIGSSYGKSYFLRHAKQTTGIATINQRVLKAFPLLLPPLPEQLRIAEMVREQISAIEKARSGAEEELNSINALPAALLRRAFNGEI